MKVFLDDISVQEAGNLIYNDLGNDLNNLLDLMKNLVSKVASYPSGELFIRRSSLDNLLLVSLNVFGNAKSRPHYLLKRRIDRIATQMNPTESYDHLYDGHKLYYWNKCSGHGHGLESQFQSTITTVSELKFNYGDNSILYSVVPGKYGVKQHIAIIKENNDINYKSPITYIDVVENLNELDVWLNEKQIGKKFKASPKHGMAGINNWRGEAKLYCQNEAEAQGLLDSAIASEIWNDLYCVDKGRKKYIVFKNENFYVRDNGIVKIQFHGYHVENKDVVDQIPKDILQKLPI